MERVWLISNVRSGTATPEKCAAIEAGIGGRGMVLVGRTRFPDDPLPDAAALDAAEVDTVVLYAGDGTINAALCKFAEWDGAVLILPGGTMNLLAKQLHASLDPLAIVAAAQDEDRRVTLPYVAAQEHRAFVAMIVGPATAWVHAREAARERRIARAFKAAALAWRRSFGRGVRLEGAPPLRKHYQAVTVTADEHGLAVAGIDARDWRALAGLGWGWLTGEWLAAQAVDTAHVPELRLPKGRPARCLCDGEPVTLAAGTRITAGQTRRVFLTTGR